MIDEQKLLDGLSNIADLLKNQDFLLKQMLNRQQELINTNRELADRIKTLETKTTSKPAPFQIMSQPLPQIQEPAPGKDPPTKVAVPKKQSVEAVVKKDIDDLKFEEYTEDKLNKFVVCQVVKNEKTKNLFNAKVTILQNGEVVDEKSIPTNGEWQSVLAPGKYVLKIRKNVPGVGNYEHEEDFVMPNNQLTLPELRLEPKKA
jgi:hypothetical protein